MKFDAHTRVECFLDVNVMWNMIFLGPGVHFEKSTKFLRKYNFWDFRLNHIILDLLIHLFTLPFHCNSNNCYKLTNKYKNTKIIIYIHLIIIVIKIVTCRFSHENSNSCISTRKMSCRVKFKLQKDAIIRSRIM
jgi:hypothetical protein